MEKKAEEKKRKAEETANDEVKSKTKKEWDKNYEVSGLIFCKTLSTIQKSHSEDLGVLEF